MADLKDLIVNGAARIIGKTYSSEFVGNVTGNVTGNVAGDLTGNVTGNVSGSSGSCTGNAATSSKLKTAVSLTTTDGTHTSDGVSFDGSSATSIKLPTTIKATFSGNLTGDVTGNVSGNAGTATKLKTARSLKITDDGTNTSTGVDFDGSDAVTLKLPSTIKASITGNVSGSSGSCTGNAATATKATNDSADQQINTTYIKGLSVDGRTITYTKGNDSTGTITTQDTTYSSKAAASGGTDVSLVTTGEKYTWDSKADGSHTHAISDITNLQSSLDAKLATSDLVSQFLSKVYPVGSVYLSVNSTSPSSFLGGEWSPIGEGYALWTVKSGAGGTIGAGLPNITGSFTAVTHGGTITTSGVIVQSLRLESSCKGSSGVYDTYNASFDASRGNSIYGKSPTVQPPAYKVYAWRRTK